MSLFIDSTDGPVVAAQSQISYAVPGKCYIFLSSYCPMFCGNKEYFVKHVYLMFWNFCQAV